jgi:hypothetical protein
MIATYLSRQLHKFSPSEIQISFAIARELSGLVHQSARYTSTWCSQEFLKNLLHFCCLRV